jgi:uncharacterized protein (TIGR02246 family)
VETWEVSARAAIRDLVARYNSNGDAGRLDAMLELFLPDAVVEVNGRSLNGIAAIRSFFEEAASATRSRRGGYVRHFTATHQIDFADRETAHGRCYFQALTEIGLDHWGRYVDEYRRTEGGWRFARRSIRVDPRSNA